MIIIRYQGAAAGLTIVAKTSTNEVSASTPREKKPEAEGRAKPGSTKRSKHKKTRRPSVSPSGEPGRTKNSKHRCSPCDCTRKKAKKKAKAPKKTKRSIWSPQMTSILMLCAAFASPAATLQAARMKVSAQHPVARITAAPAAPHTGVRP